MKKSVKRHDLKIPMVFLLLVCVGCSIIPKGEQIVKYEDVRVTEWEESVDSISRIPNSILHTSYAEIDLGFIKQFSTLNGEPFYYNGRHGFYVKLPNGLGYKQSGESEMGGHCNKFYNNDSTLVISAGGMFYDALLDDFQAYADSLCLTEEKWLNQVGKHTIKKISTYEWVSEGKIDSSNKDLPKADYFMRKWLLKKDISGRDCEMEVTIYYPDSLRSREGEFRKIVEYFPAAGWVEDTVNVNVEYSEKINGYDVRVECQIDTTCNYDSLNALGNKNAIIGKGRLHFRNETANFIIENPSFSDYRLMGNTECLVNGLVVKTEYVPPTFKDNSKKDLFNGNESPFFFYDIDFDGKEELIVTLWEGMDYHNHHAYSVYKIPLRSDGEFLRPIDIAPFNQIDDYTLIDSDSKTISICKGIDAGKILGYDTYPIKQH